MHMDELTMFPFIWFRKKGNIESKFCSLIIISGVGNQMIMYELNRVHEMSVWSTNVCEKYPSFLLEGNEQVSFSKSLESL